MKINLALFVLDYLLLLASQLLFFGALIIVGLLLLIGQLLFFFWGPVAVNLIVGLAIGGIISMVSEIAIGLSE